MPLASHHFALWARLKIVVEKPADIINRRRPLVKALSEPCVANRFALLFDECMAETPFKESSDLNQKYACILDAFAEAGKNALPVATAMPKKPWISDAALGLIDQRSLARRNGRKLEESILHQELKARVNKDRTNRLNTLVSSGDWDQIRKLRKEKAPNQGRLKGKYGQLVSCEDRAETLAEHLETVQRAVRPALSSESRPAIRNQLPVNTGEISECEVVSAAQKLKDARACGLDLVPGEYWKAICHRGSPACRWAAEFCASCWRQKAVPDVWHDACVTTIFKKGDPSDCNNYRPISLVQVGYKLFAQILLARLQ